MHPEPPRARSDPDQCGPGGEGGSFYFMAPGDRFDMVTREATRPGRGSQQPIGRVKKKGR